jgi:hypothetical protein
MQAPEADMVVTSSAAEPPVSGFGQASSEDTPPSAVSGLYCPTH